MYEMKKLMKKILLTIGVVCFVLFLCQPASAKSGNNFSATQVSLDASGNVQSTGKIYVSNDKIRLAMKAPQGNGQWVIIFRQDLNKHWMLNPEKKLYSEQPYDEQEMQKAVHSSIGKEKILGTEKVNGYKCTKKEVENTVTLMGFSKTSTSTIWHSDHFNMPLRTRGEHGETELRDIIEKKPDPQLFELPSGYAKVDNMFALFGSFDKPSADTSDKPSAETSEDASSKMPSGLMEKLKGLKNPFGK